MCIRDRRTFVNAKTLYNQELEEDNLKVKNEELGKKIEAEQKRLETYEQARRAIEDEGSVVDTVGQYLDAELENYKMADGSVPIQGPGIVITLEDSDKAIEPCLLYTSRCV